MTRESSAGVTVLHPIGCSAVSAVGVDPIPNADSFPPASSELRDGQVCLRGARCYSCVAPMAGPWQRCCGSATAVPALVAQGIERWFPVPKVRGSNPFGGTIFSSPAWATSSLNLSDDASRGSAEDAGYVQSLGRTMPSVLPTLPMTRSNTLLSVPSSSSSRSSMNSERTCSTC